VVTLIAGVFPPDETTGAVPVTLVTVPLGMDGNVVKSPAPSIYCESEPAQVKAIAGVDVEFETATSSASPPVVDDTLVTVPVLEVLLLNVVQSELDKAPLLEAEAVGTFKVTTAEVLPLATLLDKSVPEVPSVNAATEVTVPVLFVLLLNVLQSVELKYPLAEADD
jgi:hypothetical protein